LTPSAPARKSSSTPPASRRGERRFRSARRRNGRTADPGQRTIKWECNFCQCDTNPRVRVAFPSKSGPVFHYRGSRALPSFRDPKESSVLCGVAGSGRAFSLWSARRPATYDAGVCPTSRRPGCSNG
jgi:hypothetical protein